jgi:hypothetical protein
MGGTAFAGNAIPNHPAVGRGVIGWPPPTLFICHKIFAPYDVRLSVWEWKIISKMAARPIFFHEVD